jgi:diaminopimelate epimerase
LEAPIPLIDGTLLTASLVSMGNPHLIVLGALWDDAVLMQLGPALEKHVWFPSRINVHSVQIDAVSHLTMRHWERGAGPTLACGTGAAAAGALSMRLGYAASPVQVRVPGGTLEVEWSLKEGSPIFLTGTADEVFSGDWIDPDSWRD